MNFNLLRDPIFLAEMTSSPKASRGQLDLPGVLAGLSSGAVTSFPKLRPHQAPYFHMFLCQLAAMAMDKAGLGFDSSTIAGIDADAWRKLIRALTPEFSADEPWDLLNADDSRPAFLQAPVEKGVKDGKQPASHETPDEIDLIGTTRAHAQKRGYLNQDAEHWIHALICRQTAGGYWGKNNFGVMRAPGSHHPRYLVSLIPSASPSARFQRDVRALLATKPESLAAAPFLDGSHGVPLLWVLPWDGDRQLNPTTMGPWTIEMAMRLRLTQETGKIACIRRLSTGRRISEGTQKSESLLGRLGDPWAPIYVASNCAANLEGGRPTFEWMTKLVFDTGVYRLPALAKRVPEIDGDEPRWLRVEGIHAKDGKTSWCEKTLEIPARARFSFGQPATPVALDMLADIQLIHSQVLMPAMMAWFEGDDLPMSKQAELRRDVYPIIRETFSAAAEGPFFACAGEATPEALELWRAAAREAVETAYDAFLEAMPGRESVSRRKRARGVGALRSLLHTKFNMPAKSVGTASAPSNMMTTISTRRQTIETAVANILALVSNPSVLPAAQFAQVEKFEVHGLAARVPNAFWKVVGQAVPAVMQDEFDNRERMAWFTVAKAAAIVSKMGGKPLPFGEALKEAGVSRIRYDHIMQPMDEDDRRMTLDSTVQILSSRGVAFMVRDIAFQLLLSNQERDVELERIDRDYVRAEMKAA